MNQENNVINNAWEKVKLSRNINRPSSEYYINNISDKFVELHGDRCYGDDSAVIAGICKIDGISATIIGITKGNNTKENIKRNFGMPKPEGYKKSYRLMKYAENHNMPILCFVDTPGAYCGVEAEENGQGMAIANNLLEMSRLKVPIISIFIGEGGSGGALALGIADKVLMLENAIYSILSPEGFSSILWKDASRTAEAASVMKLTANDLKEIGIIDRIIEEPDGGAHNNRQQMTSTLKLIIVEELKKLMECNIDIILERRYDKFRKVGNTFD
ncbi:acetyl-coenzyme A carboxylase carboxyl transferase subunit alpha [Clostridium zeae]|uniref:Acetyl-coenzyme A carboxylase carboxyl transferase subunit alpha n=1 Tax=Clostridium zeae TaxID=2759022 RepID=A0ABQ1E812_9CLOT|nr:acetyl-CoA carboxylase carboxyltransferase subunit alpha [Clostridium zeae]GFZ30855.1 acetyl-coenzyme A carboxylase carboxyl transferase subunit alpha [Clostridium zeae]